VEKIVKDIRRDAAVFCGGQDPHRIRPRLGVSEMLETGTNDHDPGVTFDQAPKDGPFHEIVIVGVVLRDWNLPRALATRLQGAREPGSRSSTKRARISGSRFYIPWQPAASISTSMRSITLPKRIGIILAIALEK
jgi:hypothetical protein